MEFIQLFEFCETPFFIFLEFSFAKFYFPVITDYI